MTTPGWYPDPSEPELERYWDGSAWTRQSRPATGDGSRRRPIGRLLLFAVAVLATVAGTIAAVVLVLDRSPQRTFERAGAVLDEGRDSGEASLDDVTSALRLHGIACSEPVRGAASGADVLADLSTEVDGTDEVRDEIDDVVDSLDAAEVEIRACGRSALVTVGDRVHLAALVAVDPEAAIDVSGTGVRVAAVTPPLAADVVDALEDDGDSCQATTRTVTRAVLIAQVAARAASGGPAVSPSEQTTISHLPETDITVHNCRDSTVYGVRTRAQAVVLGSGSKLTAGDLLELGPLEVAAP